MSKKPTKQEQLESQVLSLRAEGATMADIADRAGIDTTRAVTICDKEDRALANARAARAEMLFARLQVDRQGRVNRLAELQGRLQAELATRDLSDIPTDKLVSLIVKTSDAIKSEVYTPQFRAPGHYTDWQNF